jgi:hypothetical protein
VPPKGLSKAEGSRLADASIPLRLVNRDLVTRQIALEWLRGAIVLAKKTASAKPEPVMTVLNVIDAYSKGKLPDLKIGKVIEQTLRRELKPIFDRDVRSISDDDIRKIVAAKHDVGKRAMGNVLRDYTSGMFTFAVDRKWVSENPVGKMKRLYKPKKKGCDRVLSDLELGAVLRAADRCEGPMSRAMRFLIMTATRRSEASKRCGASLILIK